ncbi:MAG: alginate export family protein [Chthoniobacter sp.]|nr:alginate export family protein [Chthoniobacter sp.]
MNKRTHLPKKGGGLFAAALLAGGLLSSFAGETDVKATVDKTVVEPAPETNPLSFFDGKVVFDLQERLRWENRSNNFDFNSGARAITDGNWFEQRFRIGVAIKPVEWLKIYAQGQDVREFNGRRPLVPGASGAEGDDAFDLRQAYIEISDYDKCPWGLKVGRQELSYGDERLVGVSDWTNYARTFDAAKVIYKGQGFSLEAFTSTPAIILRNEYDQSDLFNGNETNRDLVFSGAYLSLNSLPFGTWDFYSFVLDQANGNVGYAQGTLNTALPKGSLLDRSDFVTLGSLIKGDPKKLHGWEFSGEFAWQGGKVRDLNLNAFAVNAGVGYNFLDTPWVPRIFVEYNYASGDDNPASGDIGTFQNLFPTNHKFYGIMDMFSWQNMQDAHVSVSVQPTKALTAQVDYYAHWLANNNDAWYRANGINTVRPLNAAAKDAGNYQGSEVDFILTWNVKKYFQVQGGYAHFFAGSYLSDTGAHDDADFGYVQALFKF